jgi:putative transposase
MWKAKYGANDVSHLQRFQELEEENLRLKEIFAGSSLEYRVMNDVVERKLNGDD